MLVGPIAKREKNKEWTWAQFAKGKENNKVSPAVKKKRNKINSGPNL
jgi:hypothetical protein